jgi:Flp pilus assembly protein TadG
MKLHMPLRRKRRNRSDKKPGQAIIEMAFVMTLLLILSFGIADFGLLLTAEIQASNCAREIARRAVVRDASAATACSGYTALNALIGGPPTVTLPAYMDLASGTSITARVDGDYTFIAIAPLLNNLFPGSLFPATSSVGSETTMRMEGKKIT